MIKVGDEARHDRDVQVTLYGQEKDSATAALTRMNMILHDQATALVEQGNTLANPLFKDGDALKTFDYVVANPPFSDKRWSTGLHPNEGGKSTNSRWARFVIQRIKTRWGSCSPASGSIRLNLELAKKPHACLEYIIVHEMMHLLEPTHNSRFAALMDHYMPQWPRHRDALNRLPVRHEQWRY